MRNLSDEFEELGRPNPAPKNLSAKIKSVTTKPPAIGEKVAALKNKQQKTSRGMKISKKRQRFSMLNAIRMENPRSEIVYIEDTYNFVLTQQGIPTHNSRPGVFTIPIAVLCKGDSGQTLFPGLIAKYSQFQPISISLRPMECAINGGDVLSLISECHWIDRMANDQNYVPPNIADGAWASFNHITGDVFRAKCKKSDFGSVVGFGTNTAIQDLPFGYYHYHGLFVNNTTAAADVQHFIQVKIKYYFWGTLDN